MTLSRLLGHVDVDIDVEAVFGHGIGCIACAGRRALWTVTVPHWLFMVPVELRLVLVPVSVFFFL